MASFLCKPVFGGFLRFFNGKKSISRNADIDSTKQGFGFQNQRYARKHIRINKYKPNDIQHERSARYYLSGFRCIPSGMICWIIPDKNGEALLESCSEPIIWLHDILVELLDAGLITEDEYWYPYMTIFERLAR